MKKNSICKIIVSGLLTAVPLMGMAQQVCGNKPWSVRMAESEMVRCPESWQLDFQTRLKWDYCHGLELQAMLDVYDAYGDKKFFDYAVAYADTMIHQDGSIETYKLEEYNIDRLNSGKMLFRIYEQTKDEKYKKALDLLRSQLDTHPRNADGGFWHKKIYENQMWLDGLYMGQPFYAEYAYRNNRVNDYADIINQFVTVARHNYDPKTDLYRHACDVSKREKIVELHVNNRGDTMRKVLGLLLLLVAVSGTWAQERQDTIVVSRDGTGNFRTLQEAIESARAFMDYTVTIYVKNGVYKEKVIVPSWVENIDIIGEDRDKTIITYDDHANINKMGTFRTYTVKVEGSDITFKNLTIENNAAQLGQAVALHTEGDRLKFINCRILGNQDTIYTGAKFTRLYFKDCYIDGTTDFIFGPSTALFEDCIIHSKRNSYVTAASLRKRLNMDMSLSTVS